MPKPYYCRNCGQRLLEAPEHDRGDWFIRCLDCGAYNLIKPVFEIVGWRY